MPSPKKVGWYVAHISSENMYSNFTKVSIQQFNPTYVASSGFGQNGNERATGQTIDNADDDQRSC